MSVVKDMLEKAKIKGKDKKEYTKKLKITLGKFVGEGTFANVYINDACEKEVVKVIDIPYTVSKFYPNFDNCDIEKKQYLIHQQKQTTSNIINAIYQIFSSNDENCKHLVKIENDLSLSRSMEAINYVITMLRMPLLKTMDYYVMDFHEATYIDMMLQLAKGIKVLHDHNYIHRDIKPDNIFVEEQLDGSLIFKIGDFGLMLNKAPNEQIRKGIGLRTEYFAPCEAQDGIYGEFTDIYSLGVSVHYMASGGYQKSFVMNLLRSFYKNDEQKQNFKRIENCSDAFWAILTKCIKKDYRERYSSIDELINDLTNLKYATNEEIIYHDFNSKEHIEKSKAILELRALYKKRLQQLLEKSKQGILNFFVVANEFKDLPEEVYEEENIENQKYKEPFDHHKLSQLSYCLQQYEDGNIYAINNLGCMFASGDQVKKDYEKALMYFKMVQHVLDEANQNLHILRSLGVDIHGRECAYLDEEQLINKANKEDVIAIYQLVNHYFLKEKYEQALPWLQKGAQLKDYLAMKLLEEEYRSGAHLPKDMIKADQLKLELSKMRYDMERAKVQFHYIQKEITEEKL